MSSSPILDTGIQLGELGEHWKINTEIAELDNRTVQLSKQVPPTFLNVMEHLLQRSTDGQIEEDILYFHGFLRERKTK